MLPPALYPHLHGMSKQVIRSAHNDPLELSFGLDLLLRGLEQLHPTGQVD
jgi:hypothetical protein